MEDERVERRGQEGSDGGRDAGGALRDAISTPVKPITVGEHRDSNNQCPQ